MRGRNAEIGTRISKAIARRLTRLEDRLVPRETEESRRILEWLGMARARGGSVGSHIERDR
jgi:hypothetical protein